MTFIAKLTAWRRLLCDRRGNVALIAALCAPLLIGAAGFSIDFANASYVNQRLAEAADAAVLASVSQGQANALGGYGNTAWLQAYGLNVFNGNVANLSVTASPNLTVTPTSTGGVTANITYSAAVPTYFAGILGMTTLNVSGSASATASPTVYINYYIIVDISQSMGIGSTSADMGALYSRTEAAGLGGDGDAGCIFGCHVPMPGQTVSTEFMAHNVSPKITLRIDSAVSAIQSIISAAQTSAGSAQNIKIGLYTMNMDPTVSPSPYINTIQTLTSNYTQLSAAASTIDLGNNNSSGPGDTNFTAQLSKFNTAVLTANGSGASAASPLNYVFIVTDGVSDILGSNCTYTHCTAAFDPTLCTPLKAKATVGVIYTTYLPIYKQNNPAMGLDENYSLLVAPFASQIAPNLQACATSSQYYYEATSGPQIVAGMNALFASSEQAARLTK